MPPIISLGKNAQTAPASVAEHMRIRAKWLAFLSAAAICGLTTCLPSEPDTPVRIGFALQDTVVTVPVGGAMNPAVYVMLDGDTLNGGRYRLESLDSSVVGVDSTGYAVVGRRRATTLVRARFVNSASGEAPADTTFRVHVVVGGVRLAAPLDTLQALGDTLRFIATPLDASGDAWAEAVDFLWSSSSEEIVVVDSAGLATAVGEGTATIQAAADDKAGSAELAVIQVVSRVSVSPAADTVVAIGWTTQLTAVAWLDGVPLVNARFRWSSSDTNVAVVDTGGIATARAQGTTAIIAEAGNVADTAEFVVDQVAAVVRLQPGNVNVALHDTTRLIPMALDSNDVQIGDQIFTWSTDAPQVATVDSGLVTGVGEGSASVRATVDVISSSTSVAVLVPASVELTPSDTTLAAWGDTLTLSGTVRNANGEKIDAVTLAWASTNDALATVSAAGVVTALGNGIATITATATGGLSSTAQVIVAQAPVDSLHLPVLGASISTTGAPLVLTAQPMDESGAPVVANVYWRSLNPEIATVNRLTGEASAEGCGQVPIEAEAAGVHAYVLLTVSCPKNAAAASISWSTPDTLDYSVGVLWGASSDDIWATGISDQDSYTHLVWHYDGAEWALDMTVFGHARSIWGTSTTDVWMLVTDDQATVWHYDGVEWTSRDAPGGWGAREIWGTAPNDVWLCTSGGVYRFDGTAWVEAYDGEGGELYDAIWGASTADVWIGGSDGAGGGLVRRSVVGWIRQTVPFTVDGLWGTGSTDMWVHDQGTVVGHRNGLWQYRNVYPVPASDSGSYFVADVTGLSPDDVYFGLWGAGATHTGVLVNWTGSTLSPTLVLPPGSWASVLWTAPDGTLWVGGGVGGGGFVMKGERWR